MTTTGHRAAHQSDGEVEQVGAEFSVPVGSDRWPQ